MKRPEKHELGLVADVGGTNVRFALAPVVGGELVEPRAYRTADFAGIVEATERYLDDVHTAQRPRFGVFALAGVVRGDEVRITNGDWRFSSAAVQRTLGFDWLHTLNDFAALGWALPSLRETDLVPVAWSGRKPTVRDGAVALLGPGTGLGVSAVHLQNGDPVVLATEGGHIGLAPGTPEEADVLRYLQGRFERVSYERVLSGQGLSNLYCALSALYGTDRRDVDVAPEEITARAATGKDPLARRTLDMFCALFGAFAGDAVLMLGAWDGVYLTGGLVTVLIDSLDQGAFRARFEDKGRFAAALAQVPTVAITHPNVGLMGAAAVMRHRIPAG